MTRQIEGVRVLLTRELALEFANMTPVDGERPFKEGRLEYLKMQLEKGTFFGVQWDKGIERGTDKLYRLNGQHSSHLLADLDPDHFPQGLFATVTTWEFDAQDKPTIFDYFDNPRSARSNTDKMNTYRVEHSDLADIDLDLLVHTVNGVFAYNAGLGKDGVRIPPRDRGVYLKEPGYRQFARWLHSFKDSRNKWLLGQAGITAEMLAAYNKSESIASEFWGNVLREDHPDADHESRELARTFNEWKARANRKTQADFRKKASVFWKRYSLLRQRATETGPTPEMPSTASPAAT
jgi:hypothetical protein